jgi:hypothetical protein
MTSSPYFFLFVPISQESKERFGKRKRLTLAGDKLYEAGRILISLIEEHV